jgi:hypothetical protein
MTPGALAPPVDLPTELQIEVTAACNLRCEMCLVAYRPPLDRTHNSFTIGRFRQLLDELPDLEKITLQVMGAGARPVAVPRKAVRYALAAGWHARLVPAEPDLYDLFMRLPLLDTSRAARELGWRPVHSSRQAVQGLLEGMRRGAGGETPPLQPDSPARRLEEVSTGMGERN